MNIRILIYALGTVLLLVFGVWISAAYATQLEQTESAVKWIDAQSSDGKIIKVADSQSTSFLGRLYRAMARDRSRLLWSIYPASVRGQVILDASPGSAPFEGDPGY